VSSQGRNRARRRGLLALVALALVSAPALPGDLLQFTYNVPGDAKPITVHADQMASWLDGTRRIILANNNVLVEHGGMQIRCASAAAEIDQQEFRQTGILRFRLYAEGDVRIEDGSNTQSVPAAFLVISTRGEVKIKAYKGKVTQQPQPNDALYLRAQALRLGQPQTNSGPAQINTTAQGAANQTPAIQAPLNLQPAPQLDPRASPPNGASGGITPVAQWQAPQLPPQVPQDQSVMPTVPPDSQSIPALPPSGGTPPPGAGTPPLPPVRPSAIPFPQQPAAPAIRNPLGGPVQRYSIRSRTSAGFEPQSFVLSNGDYVTVLTGGVILLVQTGNNGLLDIEADRLVIWTKENPQQMLNGLRSPDGHSGRNLEFYLAGNVEIRERSGVRDHTMRANEVYYDVNRHVAVALQGSVEFRQRGVPDPIVVKAEELLQLSETKFQGMQAEIFSSRLPSDPGFKIYVAETTVEEKKVPKRSIFGPLVNPQTGLPEVEDQRLFDSRNILLEINNVPVFWFPRLRGDANDPLGPLENVGVGYNNIFGARIQTTWNMYDLLGLSPLPGTRWRLEADYLSLRGPALGETFDYAAKTFFGLPARVNDEIKAYGIIDQGTDNLGGGRGPEDHHPEERGWFLWRNSVFDLPAGFTILSQVSVLSDKNFLEQYYKNEFDSGINQETFLYVKQQQSNWAWTAIAEPRIRNWVTETEWLPRADGYLLGQSFFEIFTYNVHGSAAYANLKPTNVPPPPVEITDVATQTGRFDLNQELSAPFFLGPFRVVPYGVLDLTYYTRDLTGNERGRLYEGGGVRTSIPFTRIYPDVQSDLFNLNGINHKIVLSTNYYIAHSDTPFFQLPQLDQLNDNATDQALRDIKPLQPLFNPQHGLALATSPLFDPQLFAISRLVDDRIDTLDTIEVAQFDIRQRWQTKRGYPGQQHITDWMTLDLSASVFPNWSQEHVGHFSQFSYFEYDWVWNIGDRTALVSNGWFDPETNGPRVWSVGAFLNRPDRTNFYLGYRQIDLLNSEAITGSVTYVFSPKYAMTASTTYDVGTSLQLTSVVFTRMGSDLAVSLGLTHNSLQKTFGFVFEIVPNVVAATSHRNLGATLTPGLPVGPAVR
jgi:hypothetical protein